MLINRNPAASHRQAAFLSRLVACGLLGRAEALAALLVATAPVHISRCLRHARIEVAPAGPRQSESVSLAKNRSQAAIAARSALRPLLAAKASRFALVATATHAAHPILERDEIVSLVAEALARHLRDQRRRKAAASSDLDL